MSTNINEEQNGNGSRGSDGFMSDDEINRLAEEGAKLPPFENYCEQILFKESLQMEQADKERAWRTYLAYNVKAKNEGRQSTLNIEEYAQQAKKMGERTQETWQKFLPLKTNLSSALKNWMKAGQKLQETWEEQDFKKWQQKAARIVELMFPPKAKVSSNEKSADELRKEALERYTNLDASFPSPMEREAFYGYSGRSFLLSNQFLRRHPRRCFRLFGLANRWEAIRPTSRSVCYSYLFARAPKVTVGVCAADPERSVVNR